jgi:zinc/manganese transport system permease protein
MLDVPSLDILLPAALAGLLVLATHVPLGQMVIERGIVFIDLAVAQVAGLGVALAALGGWEDVGWAVQLSAAAAALASAALLIWCERRFPQVQEATIGAVFVVAASLELIILDRTPHGAEHLKDLLVGQILWVQPAQLGWTALLYGGIALACWLGDLRRRRALFYAVFALTITASVQLVGIYLVFASLIMPALAVHRMPAPRRLAAAFGCGLVGYALGLAGSTLADLPTGAAIVCGLALSGVATAALAARRARTLVVTP